MRSLFAKIFLWFWLATTLVATAAILAAVYTQGRPDISKPPFRNFVGEALAARGLLAVDALEHDGPTALRRHLERWERVTGGPTFLIDENGTEAIGRSLPQGAAALARHALETGTTQVDAASDYGLVATPVFGADERRYVVLRDMLPDGAGPPGFPQFHRAMRSLGPRRPPGPPPPMNPMDIALAQPGKLALMLGAVFLTGGILCYGLARYLTKPMRVLRTATTDLAGGDLTVRAGPSVSKRGDEIGQLGRDFDRMAERIESLISVERRLLRDISHELRSPLARLNVALGIARQHADGDTTGMLDRIETESERLEELIKQLLAITRIESGAQTMPTQVVDLARMLQDVAVDADFEAQSRDRRVRMTTCESCTTDGRPDLLRSAFENVVRNAVRHTARNTTVEISLRCRTDGRTTQAVVAVRDHGPGVPEDALADVFRPFYRVGDDRNRETGGVGLGLAIAERAVGVNGGSVRAANAPEGGLIVEISLPATDEATA